MSDAGFADVVRVAHKTHWCTDCERLISAGESYTTRSGVCDGEIWSARWCHHCVAANDWAIREGCWELPGGIVENLAQALQCIWEECPSLCAGRMLIGFRRQWTRRDGTLMPIPAKTS